MPGEDFFRRFFVVDTGLRSAASRSLLLSVAAVVYRVRRAQIYRGRFDRMDGRTNERKREVAGSKGCRGDEGKAGEKEARGE